MVFRSFLRIFFFVFFFLIFLLVPKKVLAAPYAYFTTAGTSGLEGVTLQYRVFAGNDSNINRVSIHVSPTNCPNCWSTIADSGPGGVSGNSVFYPPSPNTANWTFNTAGTYYVVTNVYGSDGSRCTGNTYDNGAHDLWGGVLNSWAGCDVGYASKPLATVTISPRPRSSTVQLTNVTLNPHNIYDLCINPNPNPDTMLLEYVYLSVSIQNNGGEGFNSYYIYITKLAGDGKPTNGVDNRAGWWRYGPNYFNGLPVTPDLFGASNANGYTGLVTGNRQVRVVLYNTNQGCSDCNGYPAVYDTQSIFIERDAPNYTGDWPSPNSGSPKVRTTTPQSSNPYDPAGIQGMNVTLESRPLEDVGGYGVDRIDYWVGNLGGDNAAQIKAGNPACAPSPPYLGQWFGDICKNSGPFNCPSFTAGNGQAWFINSGISTTWNTNGFTSGTRVIAANVFDHPGDRNVQNFRTYTGNGAGQYFARVDYNLMPPHAPNANFNPYPPSGVKNAIYGQPVSIPSAIANDAYGYLIKEEVAVANQARSNSFSCALGFGGGPGNYWCYLANPSFTKRSQNTISSFNWTPPNGVTDVYTVVINAFDQFGEKCSGDPNISGSPAWPPVWVNCGVQSRFTINANPPRAINALVFNDYNQDGVQQLPSETGRQGVTLVLSHTGDADRNGTTLADGTYSFTNLIQGEIYTLRMNGVAGYKYTYPPSCTGLSPGSNCSVSIPIPAANVNANFGIAASYSISGSVFLDNNKNGIKDGAPPEQNYNSSNSTIRLASDALCQTPVVADYISANGSYNFSNIYSGTYYVCYLGSSPPDLPSGFTSTSPRTVMVELTNGDEIVNFGISNLVVWFQCIGADCRNDNGLVDKIPSGATCGSYASLPGAGGTPGIIFSGDSNPDFGSGQASANPYNWMAGGAEPPGFKEVFTPFRSGVIRTSYNYMLTTAVQNGITPIDLSTVSGCSDLSNCTLPASFQNGAYKADGNLTLLGTGAIPSYTFSANKNFVILVNGDLTIKTRLFVPSGSTVIYSAARDIIVDKDVLGVDFNSTQTSIEGLFSADRNFVLEGNGSSGCGTVNEDKRLNIGGAVVVNAGFLNGGFVNQRDICSDGADCPAYSFIERSDFILNSPEFIKHPNFLWQEVAP